MSEMWLFSGLCLSSTPQWTVIVFRLFIFKFWISGWFPLDWFTCIYFWLVCSVVTTASFDTELENLATMWTHLWKSARMVDFGFRFASDMPLQPCYSEKMKSNTTATFLKAWKCESNAKKNPKPHSPDSHLQRQPDLEQGWVTNNHPKLPLRSPPSPLFFLPGFVDSSDLPAHRDPRGHRPAGRPHVLQHLPGQQEPHQPDHGQGHAHTDAQRHLCTHGESSSMYSHLETFPYNTESCLCRQTLRSEKERGQLLLWGFLWW